MYIYLLKDSVDGVVTRCSLDGPGIEFRWGRILLGSPELSRGPPTFL